MTHPVDRGWAWMVCFGVSVVMASVIGTFKSSGILFVEILEQFRASSAVTALTLGVVNAFMSVLAPIAAYIARRTSSRCTVMVGGLFCSAGMFTTAFATDIFFVIAVFGILTGLGFALIFGQSLTMIGQYFDKRRSLANGFAMAGGSIGQLIIPQIMTQLLKVYSFRGTMIVYGGLLLHLIAAGALLRPTTFYSKSKQKSKSTQNNNTDKDNKEINDNMSSKYITDLPQIEVKAVEDLKNDTEVARSWPGYSPLLSASENHLSVDSGVSYESGDSNGIVSKSDTAESLLKRHSSLSDNLEYCMHKKHMKYIDNHYTSKDSLYIVEYQTVPADMVQADKAIHSKSVKVPDEQDGKICCCAFLCCHLYEFHHLSNFLFIIFTLCVCCGNAGYVNVFLFLPAHMHDLGYSKEQSAYMLSLIGITDLVGRLCGGFIADLGIIKRSQLMAITMGTTGVSVLICSYFESIYTIIVMSVTIGLIGGFFMAIFAVVLIDFIGLASFPGAFGLVIMFMGITNSFMPTVLGLVRDSTGSYTAALYISGSLMCVSSFWILLEPLARKLQRYQESCGGCCHSYKREAVHEQNTQ